MHFRLTPLCSALLALAVAAPFSSVNASPIAFAQLAHSKVAPPGAAFEALSFFGTLAVVHPTSLLSVATSITPDAGFNADFLTGLARDPVSATVYIAGHDGQDSYLGQLNLATGQISLRGTIPGEVIVDLAADGSGHLYALTDNADGTNPHALLLLNPQTASATVQKILDAHGGTSDFSQSGAIAWNSADQNLYYADRDQNRHTFVDRIAPGTFAETPVVTSLFGVVPQAMAASGGKLYLVANGVFFSIDPANPGAGLVSEGSSGYPTPAGTGVFSPSGMYPAASSCIPSPTAACLANRFKVEATYDALPGNGTGPANVVLESGESVKFTFFNPANIEMIVKVLDACGPFGKWWVFAGGLTDVGVTLTVTDTQTGAHKTYTSQKGHQFQAFSDTAAFGCP